MKKSKIMASIYVVIAVIAIIVTIFFITNTNNGNKSSSKNDENLITNSNHNEKQEHTDEEQIKYWIEEYKFADKINDVSLNLFNGLVSTPINLTDLEDKCDYFNYGRNNKAEKISDINTTLEDGAELTVYLYKNDNTRPAISTFTIKNCSNETKNAQECIANGWWFIFEDSDYLNADKILGVELDDKYASNADQLIIEDIVTKLGRPTRIISVTVNPEEKNSGINYIVYDIVYEYSNFVLSLGIYEFLDLDSNEYGDFDISYIGYFTPESWQNHWRSSQEGNLLK